MESIQQPKSRLFNWQSATIALILLSFLFRVYILLDPRKEPVYQLIFSMLYVAAAIPALQSQRFRKQTGFWLILPCFIWVLFSCGLHAYEEREVMHLASYILMMVFAFFVCYPLAFVLDEKPMRRGFCAIAAAYLVMIAGLSGVGVYAALTGTRVLSLAGPDYIGAYLDGGRLTLFCYPTISSTFCCLALLVGLYLVLYCKRRRYQILTILAMLPSFVALALTDSRTSCAFFAICFGGFCFLLAQAKLPFGKRLVRVAAVILAAGAGCICMFGALQGTYKLLMPTIRQAQAQVAAESGSPEQDGQIAIQDDALPALADEPGEPSAVLPQVDDEIVDADSAQNEEPAAPRSLFENFSTFQGRTYAWEGAIRALKKQPALLVFGSSPLFVMEAVDPYITQLYGGANFVHLHSIFFQTLVAFGLPGLLLFAALVGYILFHALRLFFFGGETCTLAQRALPLLLFFCMAVDILEIFLSFADVMKHSNPWFFLVGGYVVYLSETHIKKRTRAERSSAKASE